MQNYFLVCGLGSLGQNCVVALKQFQLQVVAIEQQKQTQDWEIPHLSQLLDELIIGDCRKTEILKQAKIDKCRAALIVTSNEKVNAETAIAIRQLNPQTRLILRSDKENLNQLLSQQLGNLIAYEPTQLPAPAFALAALGTEILGLFQLGQSRIKVIKRQIQPNDPWCYGVLLYELNTSNRRLLMHIPYQAAVTRLGSYYWDFETKIEAAAQNPQYLLRNNFHHWEFETKIEIGDTLIYAEVVEQLVFETPKIVKTKSQTPREKAKDLVSSWRVRLQNFWQLSFQQQIQGVAILCGLVVCLLLIVGTILFDLYYPETNFISAFYATAILLLGGYADLLGDFEPIPSIPWWLQLFALILTVMGTAFVGVLYALLTESLLSSKFEFIKSRPPVPQSDHIVIIGLGRIGRKVASLLQEFNQSVVGVSFSLDFDRTILPEMPLIVGNLNDALAKVNLETAKSVVVTTDDEMLNLEIALMAKSVNPKTYLVIRTYGQDLSKHLSQLLPDARILEAYTLTAEVFAGAALGENIVSIFPLGNQNILATEYIIEANDTLSNLLISEVAYGYRVEVISHQKPEQNLNLMPSGDIPLAAGDRLVVLANVEGLQRIEQGKLQLEYKCYFVRIEKMYDDNAILEGRNFVIRVTGCSLNLAVEFFNNIPGTLNIPLYKQQAMLLVLGLNKRQFLASLFDKPTI
ncbi:potassium channel protein [Gloeocapsa sp. PCC 73106]|uniref:potassium channel protein n=1 Tax=Gloeocapsa sp. PCC 73106 TaxID=102232 RepID=UPI0002ABC7CE|nr:potassium channel protein [Gloeocapsa sp. PCC 73106]ELR98388.1 K+ transport system, NAD-binding component [Gloeocapsa sp. PCC 73106]